MNDAELDDLIRQCREQEGVLRRMHEAIERIAWLRTPFRWPRIILDPLPQSTILDRLAPPVSGLVWHRWRNDRPAPFGWYVEHEFARDASRLMPWWMYWPRRAWRLRWWVFAPFLRAGWLELNEGDYWHSARPKGWKAWWTPEREAGWRWVKTGEWT